MEAFLASSGLSLRTSRRWFVIRRCPKARIAFWKIVGFEVHGRTTEVLAESSASIQVPSSSGLGRETSPARRCWPCFGQLVAGREEGPCVQAYPL